MKFNSVWNLNISALRHNSTPNMQTISDTKSKGVEAERVDFTSITRGAGRRVEEH